MSQESKRQYRDIADVIRTMLQTGIYHEGDRLPPERNFAEQLGVGRSVVREALLMLEIEGFVAVKKGSGVYVLPAPTPVTVPVATPNNFGPFEILQARQLLESNIAEFAASQVTAADIKKMRAALEAEKRDLEIDGSEDGDMNFHAAIAEATHNNLLIELWRQAWTCRQGNPMWQQLHERIVSHEYRREWLNDHQSILAAMQKKDPATAKLAMWKHLENVKQRLMALSDVDAPEFDGFLFESYPITTQLHTQPQRTSE